MFMFQKERSPARCKPG